MYQVILYHYSSEDDINHLYRTIFSKLLTTGSIFLFFENIYDHKGHIKINAFDVIDTFLTLGFKYVNIIVYPIPVTNKGVLKKNVRYVLWFVKDNKKMILNKDAIREKHIWKDVEWGKRKKNYNPKGKDPGNVWIPTLDDGNGTITKHIVLSNEDVVNRCIVLSYVEHKKIYIRIPSLDRKHILHKSDIVYKK
jgi:hypothetical protein